MRSMEPSSTWGFVHQLDGDGFSFTDAGLSTCAWGRIARSLRETWSTLGREPTRLRIRRYGRATPAGSLRPSSPPAPRRHPRTGRRRRFGRTGDRRRAPPAHLPGHPHRRQRRAGALGTASTLSVLRGRPVSSDLYHSLEDRIVKRRFAAGRPAASADLPVVGARRSYACSPTRVAGEWSGQPRVAAPAASVEKVVTLRPFRPLPLPAPRPAGAAARRPPRPRLGGGWS